MDKEGHPGLPRRVSWGRIPHPGGVPLSLLALFCAVADFCPGFEPVGQRRPLEAGRRRRASRWSTRASMTILIHFHQSRYRDFQSSYALHVQPYVGSEFPVRPCGRSPARSRTDPGTVGHTGGRPRVHLPGSGGGAVCPRPPPAVPQEVPAGHTCGPRAAQTAGPRGVGPRPAPAHRAGRAYAPPPPRALPGASAVGVDGLRPPAPQTVSGTGTQSPGDRVLSITHVSYGSGGLCRIPKRGRPM